MSNANKVSESEWDERFMRLATEVGSWSKDINAKVGAVLVSSDRRKVSFGYNGLPWGFDDSDSVLNDANVKNALTSHAEQNAILNAPFDTEGFTLYVTKAPCLSCCVMIRQSRIGRVVCTAIDETSSWAQKQRVGQALLETLNVAVLHVSRVQP